MTPTLCDTIHTLLSVYADGEASDTEVVQVERHIRECPACASELAFFQVLKRVPGAPPVMLPPSDLLSRIAAQTYARPTWKQRLIAALQPIPVRVATTGAFVALLGFGIVHYLPAPTQVATNNTPVETAPPTPAPFVLSTPAPVLHDKTPNQVVATVKPPVRTTVHPEVADGTKAPVPDVKRPTGRHHDTRVSDSLPPTPPPTRTLDPSPGRLASLDPQATVQAGPNTPSHPVALTGGEPTPGTPARTLIASGHGSSGSQDLASAEDDTDARAAYEADLQNQSERSRQVGGVNPGNARGAFSVVQAPVTTTNK